jgi:hypothetical protein
VGCCLVVGGDVSAISKLLAKCLQESWADVRCKRWHPGVRVYGFASLDLGEDSRSDILERE